MNDIVKRARTVAAFLHANHQRKWTKEPYFVHLEEVANILSDIGADPEVIAAGYLHDSIEDVGATFEMIQEHFGTRVATLVNEVTDKSTKSDGNRATRKKKDREALAKVSPDGQTIKLADLLSNTKDIVKNDPEFAKVYLDEKAALLPLLNRGHSGLWEEALESLIKGQRDIIHVALAKAKPVIRTITAPPKHD
jgi:(p)ppGpp synthase/HD superfamily hydrolase